MACILVMKSNDMCCVLVLVNVTECICKNENLWSDPILKIIYVVVSFQIGFLVGRLGIISLS